MLKFLSIFFIFSTLFVVDVYSHSWIACAKYPLSASLYNYDEHSCQGFARGYTLHRSSSFGVDAGFNYGVGDLSMPACKYPFVRSQYDSTAFKPPSYRRGEVIRLLWPSKNHVKADCTNPYIPDTSLQLYQHCGLKTEQGMTLRDVFQRGRLLWDFQKNGTKKGFQQCLNFCTNMDKAVCYGDVQLGATFDEQCPVIWVWQFNKGEYYTSCVDSSVMSGTTENPSSSTSSTTSTPCPSSPVSIITSTGGTRLYRCSSCELV